MRIFISYRRNDSQHQAGRIYDRLCQEFGVRNIFIDDPNDFVRIEIEAALRIGIPLIPLLVGESSMPASIDLPDSMRDLAFRNALTVRPDPYFHSDLQRLLGSLDKINKQIVQTSGGERSSSLRSDMESDRVGVAGIKATGFSSDHGKHK